MLPLISSAISAAESATEAASLSVSVDRTRFPISLERNWYFTRNLEEGVSVAEALADFRSGSWQQVESNTPNFGVTRKPHWFAVNISSNESHSLFFEIGYALLDRVDFFLIRNQSVSERYLAGDRFHFTERPLPYTNFVFPLNIEAGESVTVLLRIQTNGSLQVPVAIWDAVSYQKASQTALVLHTFFAGIMITIALYNFMLFLSSRDPVFLFYALYVGFVGMTQLGLRGVSFQFLWPESPYWNERSFMMFVGAAILTGALFAHRFLHLDEASRFVRLLLGGAVGIGAAQILFSFALPYSFSVLVGILAASYACLVMFYAGLDAWRRRLRAGRFYTIAWSFFLVGMFSALMAKLGLIARTAYIEYLPEVGAAVEVILLSFAVADRMNEERRQRLLAQQEALDKEVLLREAQEKALRIQSTANQELEQNVRLRTLELQNALDELSSANAKLKMLNTIDGLTEVRNRRYFDETLAVEWARAKRNREPLALIILDADHFKDINDTYGHLAGDECLKSLARVLESQIHRPTDCIARYGGEEFAIILVETDAEGAKQVAERLRKAVECKPVNAEGVSIKMTVSLGIGYGIPGADQHVDDLVQCADQALYEAKRAGRNRVTLALLDQEAVAGD